jgi:hypothetical protein
VAALPLEYLGFPSAPFPCFREQYPLATER